MKGKKEKRKDGNSFWASLAKPFFVLAPMANVTDSVFRTLIAKYGKPDVTWTEFVSADGLISPGRKNLLHDLVYSEAERPIVAQLFTGHPIAMEKASALAAKLGFDGIDINMGCPDRAVEKQGGGAAMIKDPKNAVAVVEAARKGASTGTRSKEKGESRSIPVSVKTRIGYNTVNMEWIRGLLELRLPALTVHLRTRKEMSDVPAHWELMPDIVKMRDEISPETLIIGNGDVESVAHGRELIQKSGCDGVMIGRGIFGTPWLFEELGDKGSFPSLQKSVKKVGTFVKSRKTTSHTPLRSPAERLEILLEHTRLFEKTFCPPNAPHGSPKRIKNFAVMKKHFKAYVNGWDGAKELRIKLMETENAAEVASIVKEYLAHTAGDLPRTYGAVDK